MHQVFFIMRFRFPLEIHAEHVELGACSFETELYSRMLVIIELALQHPARDQKVSNLPAVPTPACTGLLGVSWLIGYQP